MTKAVGVPEGAHAAGLRAAPNPMAEEREQLAATPLFLLHGGHKGAGSEDSLQTCFHSRRMHCGNYRSSNDRWS